MSVSLLEVARWLDRYISSPHADVGRAGDVCPWTRRATEQGSLLLTSCAARAPEELDSFLLQLRDAFLEGHPARYGGPVFRAIVTIFPERGPEVEERIVSAHARLKPSFLARGLMLGEFYPGCEKPGLHNPSFRPLKAPWPLMVIRPMVEADIEFLLDRDSFVQAYLDAHGSRGLVRLRQILSDRPSAFDAPRMASLARMLQRS